MEYHQLYLDIEPSSMSDLSVVMLSFNAFFSFVAGREDSSAMDGPRGDPVQEVHSCFRRLELWGFVMGDNGIWRAAILGLGKFRGKVASSS